MALVMHAGSGTLDMYIGIDLAKATFTISVLESPDQVLVFGDTFSNTDAGFNEFLTRLARLTPLDAGIFIMENTGVYGERLCHCLTRQHLAVHVEPAQYIRRAFRLKGKSDPIDSRMIAEYGYRYRDQLHRWTPPDQLVERLNVLIVNRDLFQKEILAHNNILKSLRHKELSEMSSRHQEAMAFLKAQTREIDRQLADLLKTNGLIQQHATNLDTIPGVGLLYIINFLIVTDGFQALNYRNLASYLGICPHPYESGESVYKRPRSNQHGPDRMRRQLYLSAMSTLSCKEENPFQRYFQKKQAEGKTGSVIMNNLKNKLLRISCAVVLSGQPYDAKFHSIRIIEP